MNPLQRASRNRKIAYFAVILALFTVSMVWRGMIPVPLGASAARAAAPMRWAADHTIQSQAQRLEVWESDPNEGEAEITGSAVRLALTGSRGFVVTGLWLSAIEKQKRNDFHEFEQRVQMVTKLQPNFITPWIFQSWNIAYNVSVEMQGSGDMYYYIVQGIRLLAEGERRNKRSPDMRYQIAFYYQNKFGVSDQVEVLRCLFDLSCMPPSERNPDNLVRGDKVDPEAFKRFCARHPHFVRRLRGEEAPPQDKRAREKLRAATPEEIVRFLRTHYQDLPNRYRKDPIRDQWTDTLADADKQFPALPPEFNDSDAHPGVASPDDFAQRVGYFSAFKAARAWFTYSLLLLPPPLKDGPLRGLPDTEGDPLPGPTPPPGVGGHDPSKHRVPRLPTMIIFRQGAPRAQSYAAELEQKEGWFDGEGWRVDDPAAGPDAWWFPDNPNPALRSRPQDVVVGTGRAWSLEEWQRAAAMWDQHGKEYALALSDRQLGVLQKLAGEGGAAPADAESADEGQRRRAMAATALQYYATNRQTTNFPYFLASAQAEARVVNGQPLTVLARKTLWKADQARKSGNKPEALRLYKSGLEQWKRVLADNPQFHRPSRTSDRTEEETFEYELAYQRLLVQDDERVRDRANRIAAAVHGAVPFLTIPFPRDAGGGGTADPLWPEANREEIKWWVVENVADADFSSPFVGSLAADGSPWVRSELKEAVRQKQGISRRAQPAAPQPQPTGASPPAPPR
ncbi:MAG: hypothetical protein J0I06_26530 [Planctomycetes bacterium]|nr:hypothetical protein [Planctomycetota bacterium]